MPSRTLVIVATVATLFTALPGSRAQADLSSTDIATIEEQRGLRVLSSDGAVIGITSGVNINGDRTRMFLLPRAGSIFRPGGGGKDIVLTTFTDNLSLRGNDIVLGSTRQRIETKANKSFTDDSSPITILLLSNR